MFDRLKLMFNIDPDSINTIITYIDDYLNEKK